MTIRKVGDLTPKVRRRAIVFSLLRSVAMATVLVVVYYLAPLDRPLRAGTWVLFVLGLLVLGGLLAWQVRAILASATPRLRAINALGVGLPLFLLIFASTYIVIASNVAGAFTQPLSRTDGLYFTVTVFATVGFGDIAPRAEIARIIAMIQMLGGLVAVGVIAKIVFGAVQIAVERQGRDGRTPDDEDTRLPDADRHSTEP